LQLARVAQVALEQRFHAFGEVAADHDGIDLVVVQEAAKSKFAEPTIDSAESITIDLACSIA
jgi:hypothetical protein